MELTYFGLLHKPKNIGFIEIVYIDHANNFYIIKENNDISEELVSINIEPKIFQESDIRSFNSNTKTGNIYCYYLGNFQNYGIPREQEYIVGTKKDLKRKIFQFISAKNIDLRKVYAKFPTFGLTVSKLATELGLHKHALKIFDDTLKDFEFKSLNFLPNIDDYINPKILKKLSKKNSIRAKIKLFVVHRLEQSLIIELRKNIESLNYNNIDVDVSVTYKEIDDCLFQFKRPITLDEQCILSNIAPSHFYLNSFECRTKGEIDRMGILIKIRHKFPITFDSEIKKLKKAQNIL